MPDPHPYRDDSPFSSWCGDCGKRRTHVVHAHRAATGDPGYDAVMASYEPEIHNAAGPDTAAIRAENAAHGSMRRCHEVALCDALDVARNELTAARNEARAYRRAAEAARAENTRWRKAEAARLRAASKDPQP